MPTQDPELIALVKEQTEMFLNNAPDEQKVAILKRIQARQDKLYRNKKG